MKTHTSLPAAGALALTLLASIPAQAATGTTVLNEGFDDVTALEGWSQYNYSFPQGQGWLQGNAGQFDAQSGSADSFVATSFLGATDGIGSVDNWLISPLLNLTGTTLLSFFSRSVGSPGFRDLLEVRFDQGLGTFDTLLATIGAYSAYPDSWTAFSSTLNVEGSGRFAFRYLGDADALDYIGVDTVSVMTCVPEPSSWLMLALGMAGVAGVAARRRSTSSPSLS